MKTTGDTPRRVPRPGRWVTKTLPSGNRVKVTTAVQDGRRLVLIKPIH